MRLRLKSKKGMNMARVSSQKAHRVFWPKAGVADLGPNSLKALHLIVGECLKNVGIGQALPDKEAIDATLELMNKGFLVLEYDPARQTYTLVPT